MSDGTYKEFIQMLLDEQGPDEATLEALCGEAETLLATLVEDTKGIAFKTEERVHELLTRFFRERYSSYGFVLSKGVNASDYKLAQKHIGCSPGVYLVQIVWTPSRREIYFSHIDGGNLRTVRNGRVADTASC